MKQLIWWPFDEAQFFSEGLLELTLGLLDRKKQVMIAGLNLDYLGRPFGCIGQLLLHADEVIVKKAYCKCCGRPASIPAGDRRTAGSQPGTWIRSWCSSVTRRAMKPAAVCAL